MTSRPWGRHEADGMYIYFGTDSQSDLGGATATVGDDAADTAEAAAGLSMRAVAVMRPTVAGSSELRRLVPRPTCLAAIDMRKLPALRYVADDDDASCDERLQQHTTNAKC
jgi:hypothetical protein